MCSSQGGIIDIHIKESNLNWKKKGNNTSTVHWKLQPKNDAKIYWKLEEANSWVLSTGLTGQN